jgi:hypothetical protein
MFTLSMGFIFGGLTAYLTPGSVLLSIGVLVITLLCIFGAALCIPAKPKMLIGVMVAIFAACIL